MEIDVLNVKVLNGIIFRLQKLYNLCGLETAKKDGFVYVLQTEQHQIILKTESFNDS
jgi:hypothetical protein